MTYQIIRGFDPEPCGSGNTLAAAESAMREIAAAAGLTVIFFEIDEVDDGADALLSNGDILSTRKVV